MDVRDSESLVEGCASYVPQVKALVFHEAHERGGRTELWGTRRDRASRLCERASCEGRAKVCILACCGLTEACVEALQDQGERL